MTSEVKVEVRHKVDLRSSAHVVTMKSVKFYHPIIVWPLLTSEVTEVNLMLTKTSAHPLRSTMPNFNSLGQMVWIWITYMQMYRRNWLAKYIFRLFGHRNLTFNLFLYNTNHTYMDLLFENLPFNFLVFISTPSINLKPGCGLFMGRFSQFIWNSRTDGRPCIVPLKLVTFLSWNFWWKADLLRQRKLLMAECHFGLRHLKTS